MKKEKVAYIVVGWNNQDLIKECFDSILGQTYDHKEIYYVDNDSKDDSVKFVMDNYQQVHLLSEDQNHGFARGNNIGIKEALKDLEVKYIALVNTDATLDEHWTDKLVDTARSKPGQIALMQGLTLDYYDHKTIDSMHIFVNRAGTAVQYGYRASLESEFLYARNVVGVNAAAAMYTRDFLDDQPFDDYFDEDLFMYLEDVDISLRATVMGWDNYFVPDAKAYHMGSASSGKNPGFSLYMTFKNNLSVIVKNMPFKVALKVVLNMPRADYHYIRALIEQNRKKDIKYLIKGRFMSVLGAYKYIFKRSKIVKNQNMIDEDYLWDLMLKGFN